jgi:Zn-dependent peptidase ImmA (M78 family)
MERKEKKEFKNFKFELFGSTWKVEFVRQIHLGNEGEGMYTLGNTNSTHNVIYIATIDNKDKPLPIEQIKLTLAHELIHAILSTGQYWNANGDEHLVEWTARCIKSLLNHKILDHVI